MFCTSCGTKNADDNNFCKHCGLKLERVVPIKISEEDFDRAMPEEDQVVALLERAYRLRTRGETASAIGLCDEVLKLRPDSTSAHSLLAQLYEAQGDRERAIRSYERVLQINPGSIADRVKLDEMRGPLTTDTPVRSTPPPHIVLTHAPPAKPSRYSPLALVGVGGLMLLVGGALAWQIRPRPVPVATGTPLQNVASTPGTGTAPGSSSSPAGNTVQGGVVLQNSGTPVTGNVTPVTNAQSTASGQNPKVVYVPTYGPGPYMPPGNYFPQQSGTGSLPSATRPIRANNINSGTGRMANRQAVDKGERVVLPEDDSVTNDGKNYRIKVDLGGGNGGNENPDKGTATKGDRLPPGNKIDFATSDKGNSSSDVSNPPLSEARTALAMGNDLQLKGDYTRAVRAYQKALGSAGDEIGYVYQQIAYCHRQKGDKASAKTNYERAIAEYNRLVSSGKQVEKAKNGIRVCESGIKLCE